MHQNQGYNPGEGQAQRMFQHQNQGHDPSQQYQERYQQHQQQQQQQQQQTQPQNQQQFQTHDDPYQQQQQQNYQPHNFQADPRSNGSLNSAYQQQQHAQNFQGDPRSQGSLHQAYLQQQQQQQYHNFQADPRSQGSLHQQYQQYETGYENIHIIPKPHGETDFDRVSIDSDRQHVLRDPNNPNEFVVTAPEERFRLGYLDVMALVVNRMIGTGIFNSPQSVMAGTKSTGISLLFWFGGIIYCLAGMHVYIEYGLNVPRYIISGIEQSVPRSGGELNYLQFVFRKPAYRKNTFMLFTVIFGFGFIAFGNMAANCVSFANRAMRAADIENPSNAEVRGIAIGVAVATCFIHSISRRGGIWLNNILAMIKILILLAIVGTAIAVGVGLKNTKNVFIDNVTPSHAFGDISRNSNGYSEAFLAIIFSISGFEQPTYVLAEIGNPRRRFPFSMVISVTTVLVLYMVVNIAYMVVVPADLQITGDGGVAQQFFELSIGRVTPSDSHLAVRIFNAFLAVSSLGNIIVMTYTAARVKQEIAKEGILPWAKFWAQNTDLSIGRLLHWFQKRGFKGGLFKYRWFRPEQHSEKTPVGAFILHLIACAILIFATWTMTPDATYTLLSHVTAYTTHCVFGVFLGLGIFILRFYGPPETAREDTPDGRQGPPQIKTWSQMSKGTVNPFLSVLSALIYTIGSLYPVVATWVKPNDTPSTSKWYLVPTLCWAIIVFAIVWWLGFLAWSHTSHRKHEVFVVEKKPEFEPDNSGSKRRRPTGESGGSAGHGGLVLVHETVFLSWVAKENLRRRGGQNENDRFSGAETQEMLQERMGGGRDFGYDSGRYQ